MLVTNTTFTLVTKPDDGLRYMVLDPQEMEHVPFAQPGTYVLSSTEHPATALTAPFSSTRRYTCGEQPVAEIHFGAHHAFAPRPSTSTTARASRSTTTPHTTSPSTAPQIWVWGWAIRPTTLVSSTLLFNDNGLYTFRVEQVPGQTLRVNVNVADTNAK